MICLQIYKVPADEMEALATSLMGMFEKRRWVTVNVGEFLIFLSKFTETNDWVNSWCALFSKQAKFLSKQYLCGFRWNYK